MPKDISQEVDREENALRREEALTEEGRKLAGLLWSIERYGDLEHTTGVPPIYTDLAWQLQTSIDNANALAYQLGRAAGEWLKLNA